MPTYAAATASGGGASAHVNSNNGGSSDEARNGGNNKGEFDDLISALRTGMKQTIKLAGNAQALRECCVTMHD